MGTNLDLTASDGHVLAAYLALPESKPRGGLVVIQEAFGVTAYVISKDLAGDEAPREVELKPRRSP